MFKRFRENIKAKVSLGAILMLVLGVTVAAYTLPDAIVALTCSTDYAGAPTPVITLMTTVAGIVVAVVFLMMLVNSARKR